MISVIGMGPGDIKYLTLDAYDRIKNSTCLVAFGRISRSVEYMEKEVIRVKSVGEILNIINENKDVTILASGDPCFFGIVEYLKNKGIQIDEVVPGLSSFQYMMAKLKKSWESAGFISLHGRTGALDEVLKREVSVILTDESHNPHFISKTLFSMGVKGTIYAGFDLSYPEEKIVIKNIGEDIESISSLSLVVVENEMDKGQ